jgi:magnesium transporter
MPPALKPAAPSRRLLRFLRAQSEGLAFVECASRLPARRHACICTRTRLSDKPLNTPLTRREPTLQASFLGLNAILPPLTRQRAAPGISKKNGQDVTFTGGAPRYASSEQTPQDECGRSTWQEWLFGPDPKKQTEPLKEDDIRVRMEEESGSIFQRRSLTAKAALDPRLRCTEVDGNGKVIMVDGELKKSELIAKVRHPEYQHELPSVCFANWDLNSTAFSREISVRSTRPTSHTSSSARLPSS